ncbi:MAG: D-2-hydroxyacid dehydrogenase [Bacteroidetes bacterium]|nr:D-2-hydroxyacid dehydrogenase [Bacteroidota bacterium]
MKKILANDGINEAGLKLLINAGFDVTTENIPQAELAAKISSFDALLVRSATKVTSEIIDAGKNLKIIGRGGVGVDNIDVEYAKSKNIEVVNTPAASSVSVAELVFAHLLAGCRFINYSNNKLTENPKSNFKEVKKNASKGIELFNKTIGIIGFGRIGQEVARIAIGMGMNVLAYDPFFKSKTLKINFHKNLSISPLEVTINMVSLSEVLSNSDFITLHVPGGSKYLIGKNEFDMMKKNAAIINCSRGGTVDENYLAEYLKNGKLAFAGIDVFEKEPPEFTDFIGYPNVTATAHTGASTIEAQERIGVELATLIINFFKN